MQYALPVPWHGWHQGDGTLQAWNNVFIDRASQTGPLLAALLLVAGVIVLLLGWRINRLVAVLDFVLFGVIAGACLGGGGSYTWLTVGIGAIIFGALAVWLEYYGEVISCGLIAGLIAVLISGTLASPVLATLLASAVAFACAVALTFVAYREASAVMTAVQGGLLAAFGLAACLSHSGQVWFDFREVVTGVTFQLAAIQNEGVLAR
jgi:hypothetical protein